MERFRIQKGLVRVPPHVHVVALWVAVILTLAVTTVGFLNVLSLESNQNAGLRTVICRAEAFIERDNKLSVAQKRQSLGFYNDTLRSINAKPCEVPK